MKPSSDILGRKKGDVPWPPRLFSKNIESHKARTPSTTPLDLQGQLLGPKVTSKTLCWTGLSCEACTSGCWNHREEELFHELGREQDTLCKHEVVPASRGTWNISGVSSFKGTLIGTVTARNRSASMSLGKLS